MSSLYDFLNTEASSSATGGVNTAEGQDPSTVNDGLRQFKQLVAAFIDDLGAVNTVGGTGDAVTVTLGQVGGANSISAYATGQLFRFIAGAANTGAATMNVNSIGAKAIRKISGGSDVALAAGDIAAGETYTVIYRSTANSSAGGWVLVNARFAASTTVAGVVELATDAEFIAQSSSTVALTPSNLAARPAFSAHKNGSNQGSITSQTDTKLTFETEAFDIGGYFDTTNSRWTPPAGRVVLTAVVQVSGTIQQFGAASVLIYKNGSLYKTGVVEYGGNTGATAAGITVIDSANGTDYYEAWVNGWASSGSLTVSGTSTATYFQGFSL